jgi:uncharacterized protein (TIGR02597 family)
MRKNFFYFLGTLAIASGLVSADAATVSVSTVPEGLITFTLNSGSTNYLSLPLTTNETYTSSVTSVGGSTIAVGDSPAPFTTNLATSAAPYFVKFLSGYETGRVLLITGNSASALTLDTTDHSTGLPISLLTPSFNVQVGDTFEIFPADTLASVFGAGTKTNPLLLKGGNNYSSSDTVSLLTTITASATTYYFNTANGYWQSRVATFGATVQPNANNTIIYPYSALTITRLASHPTMTLVLGGRVTAVPAVTKLVSNSTVYTSTQYATGVMLSQLQFGSNWLRGTSAATADTLNVWNSATNQFDVYYQLFDATWRKSTDSATNQSDFVIPPGTVTTVTNRQSVAGAATFLQSQLPYSLD